MPREFEVGKEGLLGDLVPRIVRMMSAVRYSQVQRGTRMVSRKQEVRMGL